MARSTKTGGRGKSKKNRKHNRNRIKCQRYRKRREKLGIQGHKERKKARENGR